MVPIKAQFGERLVLSTMQIGDRQMKHIAYGLAFATIGKLIIGEYFLIGAVSMMVVSYLSDPGF